MVKITSFQVEHLSEGCVTDRERPAFSWYAESNRNDNEITEALLTVGEWKIKTRRQSGIPYNGPALLPMTAYTACLRVKDAFGETAASGCHGQSADAERPSVRIAGNAHCLLHFLRRFLLFRRQVFLQRPAASRTFFRARLTLEKSMEHCPSDI